MSAIVVATLKVVYLALLWLFVLFVANTIRTDLFGRSATAADLAEPSPHSGSAKKQKKHRLLGSRNELNELVVIAGRKQGTKVPLAGEISIGRSADSVLDIDDDYASSRHARMWQDSSGRWVIADLESTNGTYVNGTAISEPTVIGANDVIRIGRSQMKLVHA